MPPPDDHGRYRASVSFWHILADAIADLSARGYVSEQALDLWLTMLRSAAEREFIDPAEIDARMRDAMGAIYKRLVERGAVADYVPGVSRFTLAMVRPELRAELDRRIKAAADLIKINKREAVETTLRRFQGWATAIPPGGLSDMNRREAKASIGKSLRQADFERRRVAIDQGHKLVANIANITAVADGAIAAEWHSHWRQANYNYREDHKERDGRVYAIRDSWAVQQGLINKGAGYTDEMTAPGQEVYCRCFMKYISSLRRVPDEMLTRKGQEWLRQADGKRAA